MSVVHGDEQLGKKQAAEIASLQEHNNKLQSEVYQLHEKISTLEAAINQNLSLQLQVDTYNNVSILSWMFSVSS